MSQQIVYPIVKKQLIDSQVSGGRCYVRLIPLVKGFNECDVHRLEDGIIEITRILGRNPRGIDVLAALWRTEEIIQGKEDSAIGFEESTVHAPTEFIERIMESSVRFGFEEMDGVMHITYYLVDRNEQNDPDSPIQTEFGWASRFIIQQMCNTGRHIGADDELDDLFGSFLDVPHPEPPKTFDQPSMKLYSDDSEIRETQSKVEDSYNRLEARMAKSRKPEMDNTELLMRLSKMEERMQSILSVKESLLPEDSSSNLGRYKKSYMEDGPVNENDALIDEHQPLDSGFEINQRINQNQIYTVGKSGTILNVQQEVYKPCIVKDVVVGFRKTNSMHNSEQKIINTIYPINGLANPFKSSRLNLLAHFHTAIFNVLPDCNRDGYIQMMKYMVKYKSKTPSEELAFQIVSRTFDMVNFVIVANPFKLPFIEVGMQVNDPTLIKCFTMLKTEYEQLWFEQFKHLSVPDFHNKFQTYKESRTSWVSPPSRDSEMDHPNRSIKTDKRKGHYERPSKKSNTTSTILSFR